MILDEDFINLNKIDLVCHGFVNDDDYNKQLNFFSVPIKLGKFRKINYQNNLSTSDIIINIKKITN